MYEIHICIIFSDIEREISESGGYGHSSVCLHHESGYHSDSDKHFDSDLNSECCQHTNGRLHISVYTLKGRKYESNKA